MTLSLRTFLRAAPAAPLLLLAVMAFATPRTAHAGPLDDVCAPMQAYAEASGARVGFVVLDLTDGSRCSNRAGEVFRTASLYKLIVLAEAHEQARQGAFSWDEEIEFRRYRPATDDAPAGTDTLTVDATEAARLMIQLSDNDTAEALAGRLDWEAVYAAPARLGLTNTVLGERYTTTPDDIAQFFARLHAHELLGPEEDAAMLEMLRGQLIRDRIPWFLPRDVEIAHKTGRLYEYANDAGIVYAPDGPFVLVLLTESDETLGPGYEAIRNLARMAYEGHQGDPLTPVPTPAPATPLATHTPEPPPQVTPTPTPTSTPAPTPSPTAVPTPTATPAATVTPTPTPPPSPTPTPTPNPDAGRSDATAGARAAETVAVASPARSDRTGAWEPSPAVAAAVAALAGIVVTFGLIGAWLGRRPEPPEGSGG